ncbi:hypothetical protein AAHE18_12G168700 [Arachis hypogaea]
MPPRALTISFLIVSSVDASPQVVIRKKEYMLEVCLQRCKSRYRNNPKKKKDCIKRCNARYGPRVESYNNGM